ncbi:MAG TPA: aldo/keto reductase [Anaeromyxobacteraceae bacterium]|nr:aldo/keto reductase [Anaeromyxobacteraceae bacterium]
MPAIGLGTWQTFDVGPSAAARAPLAEVLRRFFAAGGRVVDTSPMYGRAESVLGDLFAEVAPPEAPFVATKVWTTGRAMGEAQMRASAQRLRTARIDLMQVHNLLDWESHLPVLREWKAAGRVRYIGVTHYAPGTFPQIERMMRDEAIDFVQIPYSLATRDAERRLLPAAEATGTAVLVMRPFEEGALFRSVGTRLLPPWAVEAGVSTWSQFFLAFVLSHPSVTCVLPATSNPEHLTDNLRAGAGPLPEDRLRRRMADELRRP